MSIKKLEDHIEGEYVNYVSYDAPSRRELMNKINEIIDYINEIDDYCKEMVIKAKEQLAKGKIKSE